MWFRGSQLFCHNDICIGVLREMTDNLKSKERNKIQRQVRKLLSCDEKKENHQWLRDNGIYRRICWKCGKRQIIKWIDAK